MSCAEAPADDRGFRFFFSEDVRPFAGRCFVPLSLDCD